MRQDKIEFFEIRRITRDIQGWLSDAEGELLFDLARQCVGKGVIIEIGSWKGKSTIWLAKGSQAGRSVPIYAIDPHLGSSEHQTMFEGPVNTLDEFKKNIYNARVNDVVTPIVAPSLEAAKIFDKPIELIFIDGAHEYDLVLSDFEAWFPKIILGGRIVFHDTIGFPGPRRFVNQVVFNSPYLRHIRLVDDITMAEKVDRNTLSERLSTRVIFLIKKMSELAVDIKLPKSFRNAGKHLIRVLQRSF